MLLSAVSVLVVAQSSSEIPEGLMNNPVFFFFDIIGEGLGALHSFCMGLVGIKRLELNSYIFHYCHCWRGKMITTAVEYVD